MIEKLQQGEFREAKIADKVNELVDVVNELVDEFKAHYHASSNDGTETSAPLVDHDE